MVIKSNKGKINNSFEIVSLSMGLAIMLGLLLVVMFFVMIIKIGNDYNNLNDLIDSSKSVNSVLGSSYQSTISEAIASVKFNIFIEILFATICLLGSLFLFSFSKKEIELTIKNDKPDFKEKEDEFYDNQYLVDKIKDEIDKNNKNTNQ